jgi:hypothetical protein
MSRYGAPFDPFRPPTTGDWVRFAIAAGGSALVPLLWLCRAQLAGRLDWRDPRDWFPYSLLVGWLWGLPAAATFAHYLRGVHEGHHDHAWMPRVFGRAQAITLALLIGLPAAYYVTTWLPLGPDDAWWRTLFRRRRWWW